MGSGVGDGMSGSGSGVNGFLGQLGWEIRVQGARGGVVVCAQGVITPGASLLGGWARCRGVVGCQYVPLKGCVEVWVVARGGALSSVEAVQFAATSVGVERAQGQGRGVGAMAGTMTGIAAAMSYACSLQYTRYSSLSLALPLFSPSL